MGFMSYFKTEIKVAPSQPVAMREKIPVEAIATAHNFEGTLPGRLRVADSEVSSISPAPSTRAEQEDRLVDEIKHQVVINHLYQHQCSSLWIRDVTQELEGVMIRKRRNEYLYKPRSLEGSSFAQAMAMLNVQVRFYLFLRKVSANLHDRQPEVSECLFLVSALSMSQQSRYTTNRYFLQAAMTVSSGVIEPFLTWSADAVDVPLLNGLRIQILPTFDDLYHAKRHQYAAFISSEALLVVWDDEPTHLLQRAKTIEAELLKFVWKTANAAQNEKEPISPTEYEIDEETGEVSNKERPILLYNCFLVACSLCLLTVLIGLGYVKIADEVVELHKWISLVFLVMTPVNAFLTLVSHGSCKSEVLC